MTVPVTINGVTSYYSFDLTSSTTQAEFQKAIDALISVSNSTGDLTSATFTKFNQALADLHQLVSGIDPATGQPLSQPITASMAEAVKTIFDFVAVFNPGGYQLVSDVQLILWRDQYFQGIQSNLMAFASTGTVGARTLQSYIQLEYVQQGNQVLFNQMNQLQQAMQLVNTSLQLLGKLQDLKNKALAPSISQTTLPMWGLPAKPTPGPSVVGSYKNATDSLKQPLLVTVDPNFSQQIENEGASLVGQLYQTIAALNEVNPAGINDSQSLQSRLTQIANDMTPNDPVSNKTVWWVLDNYNNRVDPALMGNLFGNSATPFNTARAGNFQRNINIAITTAENFNSSQNIELKSTLFSFQSFYSSASALLRAINNIITKMAGGTKG